jgi:hypothetical protein
MASANVNLDAVQNFASKDVNRIVGQIARVLARKSPFINSIDGGTLPNSSDVVRSIVEEMAVPRASLAAPAFVNDSDISFAASGSWGNSITNPWANTINVPPIQSGSSYDPNVPNASITNPNSVLNTAYSQSTNFPALSGGGPVITGDRVGTTEYLYQLQTLRGAGPRVNVKTARASFKGSYLQAQVALEKTILQIINADIRYQLLVQSGIKYVCNSTQSFTSNLTGDMQQINTKFAAVQPDSPMNFKTLYKIGTFLREEMLAEPFASKDGEFFQILASADQIEVFRNDADVKEDLLYLTAGSFKLGEDSITGYQFMGYRGFAFGIDQQPLRSAGVNNDGTITVIEPIVAAAVTNGFGQRRNPSWVSASYEVLFIMAGESFKRLVPESYVGEGTFRFAPQLAMGELEWTYYRDNFDNQFGDYGQHIYQISRAFQPIRPQNVCAVIYKRCPFDGQALACSTSTTGL